MMMDLPSLKEKYQMDIKGVLHCGGSTGQERFLYDELGVPKVYWVEAIKEVFEELKWNLKPYPNQTAIHACIGCSDGREVIFNVSNNEAQSSSYLQFGNHAVIHPEVKYIDAIPMKTQRLDTLFGLLEVDISSLNFLNLDLQGVELDAMVSLGRYLTQFDFIWTEANKNEVYAGCALIGDIEQFLYDYTLVETGVWVADSWTDCLFIKTSILNGKRT